MLNLEFENIDLDFDSLKNKYSQALNKLRNNISARAPYYKVLNPEYILSANTGIEEIVTQIKNKYKAAIIVGMGGAHLNPASLLGMCQEQSAFSIYFLNRTEPNYIRQVFDGLDLAKTAILTISNSGNTLESVALLCHILHRYEEAKIANLSKHFYFITSRQSSKISNIAASIGGSVIEHPEQISGRFSGLSNVSLIPAMLAGIDIDEYLAGASEVADAFLSKNDSVSMQGALASLEQKQKMFVYVSYAACCKKFLEWNAQILAESLAKDGHSYCPIVSMGPEDQHSLYQLFLDGDDDKQYIYYWSNKDNGAKLALKKYEDLKNITLHDIADIHHYNQVASYNALKEVGRPIQKIIYQGAMNARIAGMLTADSMLRTIIMGSCYEINTFDQPGVELIKREALKMLNR